MAAESITAWLGAIFTLALAIFTLALVRVTYELAKIASRQTDILSHTDTALNLAASAQLASAQTAEKLREITSTQAEISRGQLAEMQLEGRAWVSIEPSIGNVTWDKDGVNINLKFTLKIRERSRPCKS
jgi:hypothetical protein